MNLGDALEASGVSQGAHVIAHSGEHPDVVLMATVGEVVLSLEALPDYIRGVLPDTCRARVSIEAATRNSGGDLIGLNGEHVGMSTFGSSAPIEQLHTDFGFATSSAPLVQPPLPPKKNTFKNLKTIGHTQETCRIYQG